MSNLEIEMTATWGDNVTTIRQSGNAFSDEYNEALETNIRRVSESLITLARYEMKEN